MPAMKNEMTSGTEGNLVKGKAMGKSKIGAIGTKRNKPVRVNRIQQGKEKTEHPPQSLKERAEALT